MRKQMCNWTVCVILCTLTTTVFAGQIQLVNGDRLTGSVKQMVDGVVTVQGDLVGEVKIALSDIRSIETDAPAQLHYTDGTVKEQSLTASTDLTQISAINPPEPEKPRWKGEISAGAVYTSGNTNNESYSFSATVSKRTDKDRTTFKGDAARQKERTADGTDQVTEDWWKTSAKYDYFLSKKWYVFGEGRYETDKIADLDRRIVYGGGLGYQWIDIERTHLSTELGLAAVDEKYEDAQGSNTTMSARAGYLFDHQFNDTFSFISGLTYYPSTEMVSDYYLTSSHELRAKINDHLFTNFRVLFDYDSTPAQTKGSTDVKYLFGIGLTF